MKAPNKCPICGNKEKWICVDKSKKGFSTGKAITGGFLLGGIGLAFGGLGKKTLCYHCGNCGFEHEYRG